MCSLICCDFALWCCFFFFKQKTAYEMRISDWSSDVCSSDLKLGLCKAVLGKQDESLHHNQEALRVAVRVGTLFGQSIAVGNLGILAKKIGRASCRERVCQYV